MTPREKPPPLPKPSTPLATTVKALPKIDKFAATSAWPNLAADSEGFREASALIERALKQNPELTRQMMEVRVFSSFQISNISGNEHRNAIVD